MPSVSPAQHRLMEAAAHTSGGYDGVPQSVGREFTAADRRRQDAVAARCDAVDEHLAQHGRLGRGECR